jgi:hypothetical protein
MFLIRFGTVRKLEVELVENKLKSLNKKILECYNATPTTT